MRKLILFAATLLASSFIVASECKPELIAEIDFSTQVREVKALGMGKFEGVLPLNMHENYASWSKAFVKSFQVSEGGRKFVRFEAIPGFNDGQFICAKVEVTASGAYRCTVKAKSNNAPLKVGIRQAGAPYAMVWSGEFESSDFSEVSKAFLIRKLEQKPPFNVFIWIPGGMTDIESVKVFRVSEEEVLKGIKRPKKDVKELASQTYFPMGLPFGWTVARESFSGLVTSRSNASKAESFDVLHIDGDKNFALYSAPFQVKDPSKSHTVQFLYRADSDWTVYVMDDKRQWLRGATIKASPEWNVGKVSFKPNKYSVCFTAAFKGSGIMQIDRFSVRADDEGGLSTNVLYEARTEVSLKPKIGEIAQNTRIQFEDESSSVTWCVLNAPKDSILELKVMDVYGRTKTLDVIKFKEAKKIATGEVNFLVNGISKLGQYRVSGMIVKKDGSRASNIGETVVTRLKRPIAWNKDAPDSPFGGHFLANERTVQMMKACGINWARLHDAGIEYIGWAFLEPEKGKWKFYDEELNLFRNNHIKIFAQLGTAPSWATHYGDLGCKSLGYFERYLRPTNMVDYVNYVKTVVKRYKNTIDEYFVWNEPWGAWWKSAQDIKYYDKEKAAYDFGVFQVATSKAAKEVMPNVKISGYNTYDGNSEWTKGVDSANGAYESCDIVDYHHYTTANQFARPITQEKTSVLSNECISPLAVKYADMKEKPVYMSEGQGTSSGSDGDVYRMSGLYSSVVPWEEESPLEWTRNADMNCKYVISLLAKKVSKIFLYTMHGYTCLGVKPSFTVLVGADGYPYPSLAAFSHLAYMLEGKKIVKTENFGKEALAYTFSDGAKSCIVYSMLTKEEALKLATDSETKVTDLYGNPISKDTYIAGTIVWQEK